MATFDDGDQSVDQAANDLVQDEDAAPSLSGRLRGLVGGLWTAPTGKGEVAEYQWHPLNVTGDEHGARIVRGLTGAVGSALNLAIIDIGLGIVGLLKSRALPGGVGAVRKE